MADADKIVVGWREWLQLPQLGIPALKAKIDTGARSSSIHAEGLRQERRDGIAWACFRIAPLRGHSAFFLDCEAPIFDERTVRSSNGRSELRLFVRTPVAVAGETWDIELSLTDRASMKFPMLLGREAMRGKLMVNPARSYLGGRRLPHYYRDHGIPKKAKKK